MSDGGFFYFQCLVRWENHRSKWLDENMGGLIEHAISD